MSEVFIVDAMRTPIGSFGGTLAQVHPAELARTVIASLLERSKLDPAAVDEVVLGCILQAGFGQNISRQAAIHAGIPVEKTAQTVNMMCGSGMRSVAMAAQSIIAGDAELVIAGGSESMSMAPYLLPKARQGYRLGHGELQDSLIYDALTDIFNNIHMGVTAENLAERYGISREQQDAFAAASQAKASKAVKEGVFDAELVPVAIPQRKGEPLRFARDEYPKESTTVEALAKLRPAFKAGGTVTAGNASGINDGAAALLVASEAACKLHGLKPIARIASYAWAGVEPAYMGIGPVPASRKALQKAGWSLADVDLIEANEAFAAQALSVGKELEWDPSRVNVNGGAIALGHPVGASGARILVTLLHEMGRRSVKKGLATLCIGGGMGIAMCVERI
ncbi:MAG: acetyl-CoA C-acetyltransferase [Myxococcota bacterium]|jgi:acetyl-CoA C-acetyltransferase|nr:acetyl-CoA C-acetyltransferase [Myxococcota bacterium]